MKYFAVLSLLATAAFAAPLANPAVADAGVNAVARSGNDLAIREAAVSVEEARQLAPGGLSNIDLQGLIDQITVTLRDTVGLTTAQVKTVVSIVEDILKGKGLNGLAIGKLLSIPSSLLVKLPAVLAPILIPATAALPGINQVVVLLLNLLQTLGGLVGGLSGLLGGLGSLTNKRALEGVNVDAVLGQLGSSLKNVEGLPNGLINTILSLVKSLLGGGALSPSAIGKLGGLPTNVLAGVIGAISSVVSGLPVVGALLSPLLTVLQLLLVLGGGSLLGSVGGSVDNALGGALGGNPGPISGIN